MGDGKICEMIEKFKTLVLDSLPDTLRIKAAVVVHQVHFIYTDF